MKLQTRISPFFLLALFSAACSHVLFSLFLSVQTSKAFDLRAPNIRQIETAKSEDSATRFRVLIREYDREKILPLHAIYARRQLQSASENKILIVGTSVSWGYPMSAEAALSGAMARQFSGSDLRIANLAIIGANSAQISASLCYANTSVIRPTIIFIEVPIINDLAALSRKGARFFEDGLLLQSCALAKSVNSADYFSYFVKRPWGISMPARLRRSYPSRETTSVMRKPQIPDTYKLKPDLVVKHKDLLENTLLRSINIARKSGAKIVLFPSPLYRQSFKDIGVDDQYIIAYLNLIEQFCASHPDVKCVSPNQELESDINNFYNITHLNRHGIEQLTKVLLAAASEHME